MWKLRNFTLKSENYVKSISRNIADFFFASNECTVEITEF